MVHMFILVIAFVTSVYSVATCDFLSVNILRDSNRSIGMFQFSFAFNTNELGSANTCNDYPEGTEFDSSFTASKVFAVMAATIGGIAMLCMLLAAHWTMSRMALRIVTGVLLLCMLLQALTLVMLQSSACKGDTVECELSHGAVYSIVGAGYWFLGALAVWFLQL